MVAVNLAGTLVEDHRGPSKRRVLLLDLDFCKGDVSGWLDLESEAPVGRLLGGGLDVERLRGSVAHHRSGLDVLTQPLELADIEQTTSAEIERLLAVARAAYDVVVVDCGSRVDAATLTSVMHSDTAVVVLTPRLVALRNAIRLKRLFATLQVQPSHIQYVVNRYGSRFDIPIEDIEFQLATSVTGVIGLDESTCARAETEGRLLRRVAARGEATIDLEVLTDRFFFDATAPVRKARRRWSFRL
jgi:Flp pilus assembly CpaE family ATPase